MSRRTARDRIATSPYAALAAAPVRARIALRHDLRTFKSSAKWLYESREVTNFTYDLTPRNMDHLAHWLAVAAGADVDRCRTLLDELAQDEDLKAHISDHTARSDRRRLADTEVRFGRRAGWYALVRLLEPAVVVETGTDKGLGTCVLAAAVLKNGHGKVHTMDINANSGYLIQDAYASVVERHVGDSVESIAALQPGVDMFIHDSWHSYEHESAELGAVTDLLSPHATVISDNADKGDALLHWAEARRHKMHFFREEPDGHWYPGQGIGLVQL